MRDAEFRQLVLKENWLDAASVEAPSEPPSEPLSKARRGS